MPEDDLPDAYLREAEDSDPDETVSIPAIGSEASVRPRMETPSLLVIHGPDRGARHVLDQPEITIGRGVDADIMLSDDRVSRIHCRVLTQGRDVTVIDQESRNGINVDGRRVQEAQLTPFSQLLVGDSLMRLECKTDVELELEHNLIHAERMAAAGILAGGVAHEFNNLNAIVLGNIELLLSRTDLPASVEERLQTIRETAYRASEVTSRLLTFVRADVGKFEPIGLDKLIRGALKLAGSELRKHHVKLELDLPPLPECMIDRIQIEQVLLNLLINARHALEERPERLIRIAAGSTADGVWVTISDTGCGIAAENLDRVFLPFFSTKGAYADGASTQRGVKGTGLGLSICHTILSNHGGELTVESEEGVGTTFKMTLPLRPPEKPEVKKRARKTARPPTQRTTPPAGSDATGKKQVRKKRRRLDRY